MTLKQTLTWAWIRARWNILNARANIVYAWCGFILKFTPNPVGQNGIFDKIADISVDHYAGIVRIKGKVVEESTAFVDTLRK